MSYAQWRISYINFFVHFFFFNLCRGTFGTAATTGLLYQSRMIGEGDCVDIGGIKIGRGKPKYAEKSCPSAALSATNAT
jgi:hypothetical protein